MFKVAEAIKIGAVIAFPQPHARQLLSRAPGAVDQSVSVVVVVRGVVIGVAAMVASVIGHGISDYPSHDRADRAADNSSGDRSPD